MITSRLTPSGLLLLGGVLIVGLRLAAPLEVGKDVSFQLEAAYHFAQGQGISVMASPGPDLLAATTLQPLTWWPPAFSIVVGVPLAAGLPLVLILKLLYGATTLAAWFGWWRISGPDLAGSPGTSRVLRLAGNVLALSLPMFLTPAWDGTDIFLWALVPFILSFWSAGMSATARNLPLFWAGVLCGVGASFRYAAFFLGIWSVLAMLTSPLTWRTAARKYLTFLLAYGLVTGSVLLSNHYRSVDSGALPSFVSAAPGGLNLGKNLLQIPELLSAASAGFLGNGLLDDIGSKVGRLGRIALGLVSLGWAILLPVLYRRTSKREASPESCIWSAASWLPLSMIAFLMLANFATSYGPLGDRRYYVPVSVAALLLTFHLALRWRNQSRLLGALLLSPAIWFVFTSLCVYPAWESLDVRRRGDTIERILSFKPGRSSPASTSLETPYPSNQIFTRFDATILKARELIEQNPDSQMIATEGYAFFLKEVFKGGSLLPGKDLKNAPSFAYPFWKTAYVNRPGKVFFLERLSNPSEFATTLPHVMSEGARVIYEDKFEKTRIWEVTFSAATRLQPE